MVRISCVLIFQLQLFMTYFIVSQLVELSRVLLEINQSDWFSHCFLLLIEHDHIGIKEVIKTLFHV